MYSILTDAQIEKLKIKLQELMAKYGQVTHRTRAQFIYEWKEYLKAENIRDGRYVDDILRSMGK